MIQKRAERLMPRSHAKPKEPTLGFVTTQDGLKVQYRHVPAETGESALAPWFVFCCPLGQCGFSVFYPIMAVYGNKYHYVCWDYRGLFNSDAPKKRRRISIAHHAEDLKLILDTLKVPAAYCLCGHSMGVQVALEFSALYEERVQHMVLLNGSHGQVFQSSFQPIFRIPWFGDASRMLVSHLVANPDWIETIRRKMHPFLLVYLGIYTRAFGSPILKELLGPEYLINFMNEYLGGITSDPKSCLNFLRLFQELDAHSLYHILPTITTPTLVVSGLWDALTPAYCSMEIARQMPRGKHHMDWVSSHATILENPEGVIEQMRFFLDEGEYPAMPKEGKSSPSVKDR